MTSKQIQSSTHIPTTLIHTRYPSFALARLRERDCATGAALNKDTAIHNTLQNTGLLDTRPQGVGTGVDRVLVNTKVECAVATEVVGKGFSLLCQRLVSGG